MTARLNFYGVACFEAVSARGRVLFDPFLTGNPVAPCGPDDLEAPDVIVVSHAAFDHMQDAAAVALRTGAPIVCGNDTAEVLGEQGVPRSQLRVTVWGIEVEVGGFLVQPVECHHWSQAKLQDGSWVTGTPMGFVVPVDEDCVVYHFGDTAIFGDLALIGRIYRPTVGLLGCTQPWSLVAPGAGRVVTGEMSPSSAALAAELLGLEMAVACHYEDPDHADVQSFLKLVGENDSTGRRKAVALRPGQSLVVDGPRSYEVQL